MVFPIQLYRYTALLKELSLFSENKSVVPSSATPPRASHLHPRRASRSRCSLPGRLALAAFLLWPPDPDIRVARLRLNHLSVSARPAVAVTVAAALKVRVRNPDPFALHYRRLDVIGYRGARLGSVASGGSRIRARAVSYIPELHLDGIRVVEDAIYLLDDLARGFIPFDTVVEVDGRLRLFFFSVPVKPWRGGGGTGADRPLGGRWPCWPLRTTPRNRTRILPCQEQNAKSGKTFQKTMVEVGDDTRSNFSVSLWSKHSSAMLAGDVVLLENVKIVEYRNALEGRAAQISAVQVLLHSKDLITSKGAFPAGRFLPDKQGIDELVFNCKVGAAARAKLRSVVEWILHTKSTLQENSHQVILKNWKDRKEKQSTEYLSISELLSQSKSCNVNIYASIGKMMLMGCPTSQSKGHISILERLSLKTNGDVVRDFITTGCKLCGSPMYSNNLPGESTFPLDCPENSKYLHALCPIYRPFVMYVYDQSGQVPLVVKNKAAEILFANITAEDVYKCYADARSHNHVLSGTRESECSSTPELLDNTSKAETIKRKRAEEKTDFHLIWLIVIKCLLKQGENSPFCFEISVSTEKNVENGRFELVSLSMPIS